MTPRAACPGPAGQPRRGRLDLRPLLAAACAALLGFGAVGCQNSRELNARATDTWSRSYTLQDGGEFQVVGATGSIDVQGGSGGTVEVTAERSVRAPLEDTAKMLAPKVRISEDVAPDRIVLKTQGLSGVIIGIAIAVDYHVKVPTGTRLRLHTENGNISVADVAGTLVASSTNGRIGARNMSGGIEARSANGSITVDLASVASDPIDLRATNGSVALTLPSNASVDIDARTINGVIDVGDLPVQVMGEPERRRLRGRLDNGGTPVTVATSNGDIHLRPRP